jgi:hypothetical protein
MGDPGKTGFLNKVGCPCQQHGKTKDRKKQKKAGNNAGDMKISMKCADLERKRYQHPGKVI